MTLLYVTLLYVTLLYLTLLYLTLLYLTLLDTTLRDTTLRDTTLLDSTLLDSTLLDSTWHYSTWHYSTWLLFYLTLLYLTCSTWLNFTEMLFVYRKFLNLNFLWLYNFIYIYHIVCHDSMTHEVYLNTCRDLYLVKDLAEDHCLSCMARPSPLLGVVTWMAIGIGSIRDPGWMSRCGLIWRKLQVNFRLYRYRTCISSLIVDLQFRASMAAENTCRQARFSGIRKSDRYVGLFT